MFNKERYYHKLEALYPYTKALLGERFEENMSEMMKELREDSRTTKDLLSVMDTLFLKCADMQMKKNKKPISYLHFFYLNTALITETYEIQVQLFDHSSYMDSCECYDFFLPNRITEYYMADLEYFERHASASIVGLLYKNYQDIKRKYYVIYQVLIGQYLRSQVDQITELHSYKEISKNEDIVFIYGGYMDRGIQIYPPMEVDR